MCEFDRNLIAWLDGELEPPQSLEMDPHVLACPECSTRVAQYRKVSRTFADYCEAIAAPRNPRRLRWAAWGATAAVAAAAALMVWMPRPPAARLPLKHRTTLPVAAALPLVHQPAPIRAIRRRRRPKPTAAPQQQWNIEPSIEIAIPADALFAPGAVPPGFSFTADLSIANDGSPLALRLRP